ncbi:pseudouridine synthase [Nesterenkonia halobia]|uniref:Pseudouridine synthase n=1 Tax=Nesterenkonia halobia TaxID=37922 RepID=A0ABP6RGZ1_9MICC
MTSSGKRRPTRTPPRAARAVRTPRAGASGGPFADVDPQRLVVDEARRAKPRLDEAEDNFAAVHDPSGERLQKVLARAGVASRRVCESLIAEGRVEVDGRVVVEPGVRVRAEAVRIHVDGVRVTLGVEHQYLMFNKPAGVVTTMSDPQGRPAIGDHLDAETSAAGLVHVGRLDRETEGLLLLTNDGEMAHRLTHPSYEVPKTYLVEAAGRVTAADRRRLLAGVELEDGPIAVDECRILESSGSRTMVEVTLHSGRNRIVRRIFDHIEHPVRRLVRTAIGRLTVGDQPQGTIRPLGRQELGHLLDLTGVEPGGRTDSRGGETATEAPGPAPTSGSSQSTPSARASGPKQARTNRAPSSASSRSTRRRRPGAQEGGR